ncbi:MAG: helix-turn-helix transcriptional regulator [Actinomycetota bacterium]|nr:helix-turn-helix transcriptional regulator [Actinomycetota bacterium]
MKSSRASLAGVEAAVFALPLDGPASAVDAVARLLPVAISSETAMIFLRDTDREGDLHLAAASGFPPRDVLELTLAPLTLVRARALLLFGATHSLGRSHGFRWLHGSWLRADDEIVGLVVVASRTDRRPRRDEVLLLERISAELGTWAESIPRTAGSLSSASVRFARALQDGQPPASAPASVLRPRERAVLELFADGLSTQEVADLLVLSAHTVRTHVRNALRRLGVHSRLEAVEVVRRERADALL